MRTAVRRGSASRSMRRGLPAILFVTALFLAPPAWSGGIGGNFTFGHSTGDVEDTGDFFPDMDTTANHYEVGVTYDSNLAGNRLFNYRISANLQVVDQHLDVASTQLADIQGSGFALNQLFGFGLYRSPRMRVFLGPMLHLGVVAFDDRERLAGGGKVEYEEVLFTAGLGPELGVNLHVAKRLTVSLSAHYRYGLLLQGFNEPFETSSGDNRVFVGNEHRIGVTTSIFFRFAKDQYTAKPARRPKRAL